MVERMPFSFPPFSDETLPGWLVRGAHYSGYGRLGALSSLLGTKIENAMVDVERVEDIATMLRTSVEEVRLRMCWLPRHGTPEYQKVGFHGHEVAAHHLNFHGPSKVCPICLQEKPHHRNLWRLAAAPVCPKHKCLLVRKCADAKCKEPLPNVMRELVSCTCGRDLSQTPSIEADANVVWLWSSIEELLNGPPHEWQLGSKSSYPLNLDLNSALGLVMVMGSMEHRQSMAVSSLALQTSDTGGLLEFSRRVAEVLEDWPERFIESVGRRLDVVPKGGSVARSSSLSRAPILGWQLPAALGAVGQIVDQAIEARVRLWSSTRTTNQASDEVSDTIGVGDAAELLGVKTNQLVGLFSTWRLPSKASERHAPLVTRRSGIKALVGRLLAMATAWAESPDDQFQRWDEAVFNGGTFDLEPWDLLERVFSGAVRISVPIGDALRLDSLLFNQSDLADWWEAEAAARAILTVDAYRARRLLLLDKVTFNQAIAHGGIDAPDVREDRDRVPVSVVLSALRRLRIVSRLAEYAGLSKGEATAILRSAGTILTTAPDLNEATRSYLVIEVARLRSSPLYERLKECAYIKWKTQG
jgi:hypothetical protein